jgi:hypothetical protein
MSEANHAAKWRNLLFPLAVPKERQSPPNHPFGYHKYQLPVASKRT